MKFLANYSCWLSSEKGTIFAFVAPMLAIIIVSRNSKHVKFPVLIDFVCHLQINTVFLVFALVALTRSIRLKARGVNTDVAKQAVLV